MNTQTHILLACAVLVTPVVRNSIQQVGFKALAAAVVVGALIPDASLFVMWGVAKGQGIADSVIWGDWYYSDFWQNMGGVSNSLPLFLLIAVLAWVAGGRFSGANAFNGSVSEQGGRVYWAKLVLCMASASLLHVMMDFPLHHDDGHPHFWPFSDWIYSSPVSYWDPAHYGRIWFVIEMILALGFLMVLWRRFSHFWARSLFALLAVSYVVMTVYWWSAFG